MAPHGHVLPPASHWLGWRFEANAGSAVGPATQIGLDCLIMHGVVVGHDSVVQSNVVFCPGVCVGGYARIGAGGFVGTNSVPAPRVNIGRDGFISAGAACLRDAPANSLLLGNPAKRLPFAVEQATASGN